MHFTALKIWPCFPVLIPGLYIDDIFLSLNWAGYSTYPGAFDDIWCTVSIASGVPRSCSLLIGGKLIGKTKPIF